MIIIGRFRKHPFFEVNIFVGAVFIFQNPLKTEHKTMKGISNKIIRISNHRSKKGSHQKRREDCQLTYNKKNKRYIQAQRIKSKTTTFAQKVKS